jgi:hypothetical protein
MNSNLNHFFTAIGKTLLVLIVGYPTLSPFHLRWGARNAA